LIRSSHSLDRLDTAFDDDRLVADAGLLLPATLAAHLGLKGLVDEHLDLGARPGRANPGDKVLTLVLSALVGGDCIDDANALRAGGTERILGFSVKAASTLGTFLRAFRWGHVRQLDRVSRELLARAFAAGAGPGCAPLTIDLDSTICETYGLAKEGGRDFAYSGVRGYHPLLAVAAGTGDVLAAPFLPAGRTRRHRPGGRPFPRRDNRAGPRRGRHGPTHRARRLRVLCPRGRGGVPAPRRPLLHHGPPAQGRAPPDRGDPRRGLDADPVLAIGRRRLAETAFVPFAHEKDARPVRLIVRRVRPTPGSQLALFALYDYHPSITDRGGDMLALEADHRRHAEIENAIRDLKYGVGLNHLPSGRFAANAAWLAVQVMAHNLARWTARFGLGAGIVTTKTLRRRLFAIAGRLTRSARRLTLHLPARWPWADEFAAALLRLRALPLLA